MVSTLDFESSDPGSNPGRTSFRSACVCCCTVFHVCRAKGGEARVICRRARSWLREGAVVDLCWSYGVMVSTLDSESSDPGSNPGRTSFSFFSFALCSTAPSFHPVQRTTPTPRLLQMHRSSSITSPLRRSVPRSMAFEVTQPTRKQRHNQHQRNTMP